jgi:hypothetical protein
MVRFRTKVRTVWGEYSQKNGEETSGNEKVSNEGGSESDLSRVSDGCDCVNSG